MNSTSSVADNGHDTVLEKAMSPVKVSAAVRRAHSFGDGVAAQIGQHVLQFEVDQFLVDGRDEIVLGGGFQVVIPAWTARPSGGSGRRASAHRWRLRLNGRRVFEIESLQDGRVGDAGGVRRWRTQSRIETLIAYPIVGVQTKRAVGRSE